MYLKKLELQGFKSFPEKIKLDFNKGITAVVGPNGSGKSNISDAIRWVLGEQSAKSLRGSKMEDIIFAGTQSRKPLGFAEISITIDNSDRGLNIDFEDVIVTRRAYRSGESQFYINGSACRLKDIHELFMDTGIGKEGYSIIGQGKIDEILNAKSEDRRFFFEEAAGIVKYKNRKREAENKLEKERENLIRINDIILELESQLDPLLEQSEKAKDYLKLSERLKIIDISSFVTSVSKAEAELSIMQENISLLKKDIETETDSQVKDKEKTDYLKTQINQIESLISEKSTEVADLRSSLEKMENNIELFNQKIDHIDSEKERLKKEIISKNDNINAENQNMQLFESKYNALALDLDAKNKLLEENQQEFNVINEKMNKEEELIEGYSAQHIEKLRLISASDGKMQRSEALFEQLERRTQELNVNKEFNMIKINDDTVKLEDMKKLLSEKELLQENLSAERENFNHEKDKLNIRLVNITDKLEKTLRELNDCQSQYRILSELENSYEGYYRSVKSVLKQKQIDSKKFSGICGAVGELINVVEKYETAIEIALGSSLQSIITKDEKDAQIAIEYLKTSKQGRATFLPISVIKSRGLGVSKHKLLSEEGILGVAKELIDYDNIYENIMANLLGKVLISDNIENAIIFSRRYGYQYKIVTLQGDIINPGGSLTGGSLSKAKSNILSRSREIESLEKKINSTTLEKNELSSINEDLNLKIDDLVEKTGRNEFISRDIDVEKASLNANILQLETILNELLEIKSDYDIEERQLMEQIKNINEEIEKIKIEHDDIETNIEDIVKNVDSKQISIQSIRSQREQISLEETDIKVSISSITESISSIKENITRTKNQFDIFLSEIENITEQIDIQEANKIEMEQEILGFKSKIINIKESQSQTFNALENYNKQKENKKNIIDEYEKNTLSKLELISNLKNQSVRLEMKKEQSEADSRRIYDDMWENYNMTYQEALKFPMLSESQTELDKEMKSIKNEIKEMGTVNVNAVEEYKLVKERYDFLTGQSDDIIEAEEKLIDIINDLKVLMEKQFRDNFSLISENFNIVFKEMFGGGTARLDILDESDILESGIEIVSQPPGKALQNMSLFSGGERALTAIALLFGILKMKPSPFCILDEIESALDDANVKRFANYLQHFAKDTQFIIITHRKGTMEAADILYGVTMQEHGVSKLVSVDFTQEEGNEW